MKGAEFMSLANARMLFPPGNTSWMKPGVLANYTAGKETNWLDLVTRTGVVSDHQIAVSGADQNVNYYLSSSYNVVKGIVLGDDFSRISLLGKINTNITNWLKIGLDASYSHRDYSGVAADVGVAQAQTPYGIVYRDENRNLEKYPVTQGNINALWGVNDGTFENMDIRDNYRLNAYAQIDVPWVKGLNYRINLLFNLEILQTKTTTLLKGKDCPDMNQQMLLSYWQMPMVIC
jgi:hypothetical protein